MAFDSTLFVARVILNENCCSYNKLQSAQLSAEPLSLWSKETSTIWTLSDNTNAVIAKREVK